MTNPLSDSPAAKIFSKTIFVVALAVLLLVLTVWLATSGGEPEKKPLYWVSQMDPDFRSSAPGKCPHGMDLVPVYEADPAIFSSDAGVVRIAPQVQQQLGVRKAEVVLGSLKQTLRTSGRVIPDPTLMMKLTPRVTGWVDWLFVSSAGETVQRGQPLYALYSPQLVAVQEQFLTIFKQRNEPETLKAEADLRALGMDDIALAKLRNEGVSQRSVIFRAPMDGMVDMLMIGQGAYVEPGSPLVTIGSMTMVWVELDVFESQAALIQPRQRVTLTTPAYPGLVWETEIATIAPDLDTKTRTLRFRAQLDNGKMYLRNNMQMQGVIVLPARPPAILAPRQSIIQLGQQDRVVLDLGEGNFKSVAVTLGESNSEQVEVLAGLQAGDRLVVSAQFLVDSESSKTSDFARMESQPALESATNGNGP
jgi:Cu(I)/Ag(I) efflux system membrane fusion protein